MNQTKCFSHVIIFHFNIQLYYIIIYNVKNIKLSENTILFYKNGIFFALPIWFQCMLSINNVNPLLPAQGCVLGPRYKKQGIPYLLQAKIYIHAYLNKANIKTYPHSFSLGSRTILSLIPPPTPLFNSLRPLSNFIKVLHII